MAKKSKKVKTVRPSKPAKPIKLASEKPPRTPKPKKNPKLEKTKAAEHARVRVALGKHRKKGKKLTKAEIDAVVGESHGQLTKSEVARRIIAL